MTIVRRWLALLVILAVTAFSLPGPLQAASGKFSVPICTPAGVIQMVLENGEDAAPHRESILDGHCSFCTGKHALDLASPPGTVVAILPLDLEHKDWSADPSLPDNATVISPQARPRAPPF
ncbi:DUF2946 family protein [Lacibacterium aquatile]|uniref:DUF2946 family protein n=1 Tax=Lacibacterium aquatile TaxID=1168082 RepID=A0ABW5DU61_9PROT